MPLTPINLRKVTIWGPRLIPINRKNTPLASSITGEGPKWTTTLHKQSDVNLKMPFFLQSKRRDKEIRFKFLRRKRSREMGFCIILMTLSWSINLMQFLLILCPACGLRVAGTAGHYLKHQTRNRNLGRPHSNCHRHVKKKRAERRICVIFHWSFYPSNLFSFRA